MNKNSYFIKNKTLIISNEISFSILHTNLENYNDNLFTKFDIFLPEKIKDSTKKRKSDFFSGRYCSLSNLKNLEIYNHKINIGEHGQPIWPVGFFGSISHSKDRTVSLVGKKNKIKSVGIDIEYLNSKNIKIFESGVLNLDEKKLILKNNIIDKCIFQHIIFSAKESLFKLLYPKINFSFYFDAISITEIYGTNNSGTFLICIRKSLSEKVTMGQKFSGFYHYRNDYIFTGIVDF